MIRSAKIHDASSIAKLHAETLSSSFLASLGLKFLNSLYGFLITQENVWVYEENNEILGFVSFSQNSSGMMKRFLINCPACIIFIAIKAILSPSLIWRMFETFQAPFKSQKSNNSNNLPPGELLSISVSPRCQRSGIGAKLIDTLEVYLKQNHIQNYKVVAGEELISANKFYLKNEFLLATRISIHNAKLSNVYVKEVR